MGSNMAENHPVGFRFVMKAKQQGATVIHIDPRFSRTSALADIHVPLRAGSDMVFLGALVNYVLSSERWNDNPFFEEYIGSFTNASTIISEDYRDTEDLGGLFSGYLAEERRYDTQSWQYARQRARNAPTTHHSQDSMARPQYVGDMTEPPITDPTMQDPRCALQLVKRHFRRYTPELVEQLCGVPQALFLKVAEALLQNSGRDRTSAFCYALA